MALIKADQQCIISSLGAVGNCYHINILNSINLQARAILAELLKRKLSAMDKKGLNAFRNIYPHCQKPYLVNLGSNYVQDEEIEYISPFELGKLHGS